MVKHNAIYNWKLITTLGQTAPVPNTLWYIGGIVMLIEEWEAASDD